MAKIGIGIEAQLDTTRVTQQIDALNQRVNRPNQAGSQRAVDPVAPGAARDVAAVNRQLEIYLRLQRDLARRLRETGQGGVTDPSMIDFNRAYPGNPRLAEHRRRQVNAFVNGQADPGPAPRTGGGGGGMIGGAAQAGLRAAGPAGSVAAGALGTGMSAGFGAGLMGLMGGMLALGVGKLVGAATEKIGEAEGNAVAMDKLKRTLGDVNVSFDALKAVVHSGADNLKITYAEAGRLTQQFAKLGNVTADQYKSLGDEIGLGVGLSRGFGLDPEQGVGAMGQMRGVGVTSNTQESRRFALLIGETIGKSGAFAKADEVMDAMTGYTASQTRLNLSAANTSGFAGMFSSLVGSGMPGMDPQGAAGLLSRINSSLSGGGAKGEASQFFSAQVGSTMGLDPIQTQILREGGAFATNDGMFGEGSAAKRFGLDGPGGDKTFLQASLEQLRKQYGNNKGHLAQATSNHLGIGINQAMGLLSVDPNQMGDMQRRMGDLSKFSGNGIANMSKALYGSSSDVAGLRSSYLGRSDVSEADKERLRGSEVGSSGERDVLATLAAQYEQERTTGSDIRDSKNALDNLKVNMADKLVPLTQDIRAGIMHIAGGGKKSPSEILREVMNLESKDKRAAISGNFDSQMQAANAAPDSLRAQRDGLLKDLRKMDPRAAGYAEKRERVAELEKLIDDEMIRSKKAILELQRKKEEALKAEAINLKSGLASINGGGLASGGNNQSSAESARLGRGGSTPSQPSTSSSVGTDGKMTRGYRNNNPGNLEDTVKWAGMTGSDGRFAQFATPQLGYRAMGKNLMAYSSKHGLKTIRSIIGRWAPPGENNTEAYVARVSKQMGVGPDDELNLKDEQTLTRLMSGIAKHENGYNRHGDDVVSEGARMAIGGDSAPKPGGSSGGQLSGEMSVRLDLSPAASKLLRGPDSPIQTRVAAAQPAGTSGSW